MAELFIRYLHFIGIMSLSAVLVAEHLLLSATVSARQFKKIIVLDALYGASALLVLSAGLLLWFVVGKPADFYSHNWVFHVKVAVFILIALLSIYPTVFFLKNRKNNREYIDVPKSVISIIRLELVLLFILPLFAVLMARGIGS